MKNNLSDLNNILFEQLERLNDENEDLDSEIRKSRAISNVASQIIYNAKIMLDAQKHYDRKENEWVFDD